jgi:hypothetical protein
MSRTIAPLSFLIYSNMSQSNDAPGPLVFLVSKLVCHSALNKHPACCLDLLLGQRHHLQLYIWSANLI